MAKRRRWLGPAALVVCLGSTGCLSAVVDARISRAERTRLAPAAVQVVGAGRTLRVRVAYDDGAPRTVMWSLPAAGGATDPADAKPGLVPVSTERPTQGLWFEQKAARLRLVDKGKVVASLVLPQPWAERGASAARLLLPLTFLVDLATSPLQGLVFLTYRLAGGSLLIFG